MLIDNKTKKCAFIKVEKNVIPSNLLKDRFIVPPFSIFDTRQGYWQERKNLWKSLGIKSELGRADNLTYNLGCFNYDDEKERQKALHENPISNFDGYQDKEKSKFGKCLSDSIGEAYERKNVQATSIFDPVLTEIMYRWFSREGDKIIDPFAGGSVRGVIAACLGRSYTGIDLSKNQVEANKEQFAEMNKKFSDIKGTATWINGDSLYCKELAEDKYDMLLTCPPYYDLEVYSEEEGDISNCDTYEEFMQTFEKIIDNACSMLKDNSFAVCVVGDVRDKKTGAYYNFVGDTVNAFRKAGLHYYNEGILVNVTGTLPVRVGKQFNSGRKFGKQHQNILCFYKGDPTRIKEHFPVLDSLQNV